MHGCKAGYARRIASLTVLMALVPGAASAAGTPCPGADARPTAETVAGAQAAVECLIDRHREEEGRRPLASHQRLGVAAGAHAADMAGRGFFSHVSPGGGTLRDRLRRAGWLPSGSGWDAAEVLAWGTGAASTPRRIVNRWLRSPLHRRQLESRVTHLGVGVALTTARAYCAVVVGRGGKAPELPVLVPLDPALPPAPPLPAPPLPVPPVPLPPVPLPVP